MLFICVQREFSHERDVQDFEKRVDSLEVDRNNLQATCAHLQQDNQHLCEVIRELKNIKLGKNDFRCFLANVWQNNYH